ncbi:MAG: pyroglutamyl-peptidase I [Lachnospiraceae bacterium]|nr:pyroglutamyl-peptidase I [Lachnospiraceae bacterium]
MKILVTGFEPFNGADINPSQELVKHLKAPKGTILIKEILPVEFKKTTVRIHELLREHQPDVAISIGQAGGRKEICVERVAINLDNVRASGGVHMLPDNAGDAPVDQPIEADGENAYFSTLPVWEMVKAIQDRNVPGAVSYSAGTYVCNHVMYRLLYEGARNYPEMKAGFIHVPFLPKQLEMMENPAQRCAMLLSDMVAGVQAALDLFAV